MQPAPHRHPTSRRARIPSPGRALPLLLLAGALTAAACSDPDNGHGGPATATATATRAARETAAGAGDTTVVAGPRYRAGPARRALFGSDYRDLWTTPVTVPFLDLDTFAGGLEPVRQGGSEQTTSLRLRGADGREYNFRSVDKDVARGLPRISRGWLPEWLMQDQTSALHPAAAAVAGVLLDTVGVLHPGPRLVVFPDDPRMGELRDTFAGVLGWIETHPDENRDRPEASFAGAVRVAGSDRLFEHLDEDPELNRVDTRAYLRLRLLDILLGDWDRHPGQLRWARYDEGGIHRWVPVAEDRDYAFVSYDGALVAATRFLVAPRARPFSGEIPQNLVPLVWNGLEMDIALLSELPRDEWVAEAEEIRAELTDEVIDSAVRAMPPEWAAINAAELARKLRERRDMLAEAAGGFHDVVHWRALRISG